MGCSTMRFYAPSRHGISSLLTQNVSRALRAWESNFFSPLYPSSFRYSATEIMLDLSERMIINGHGMPAIFGRPSISNSEKRTVDHELA
jgi:hypothetical protein